MTLQFQLKGTLFEVVVGDINKQDLDLIAKESIDGRCKAGEIVREGGVVWVGAPAWGGGTRGENVQLERCYHLALGLAHKEGLRRVGFPSLGTGTGGFPIDRAVWIGVNTAVRFLLEEHPDSMDLVRYVLTTEEELEEYRDPFGRVMRTMTRL